MKVRINYPSGNVYEYESNDPYAVYNSICKHGIYGHCRNEIVECENHLRMSNARASYCDLCPVVDWCLEFRSKGRIAYALHVGVGNDTRAHTSIFENKEDAEGLLKSYISDIIAKAGGGDASIRQKRDGRYHFVDVGNTHWTLYVSEVRIYGLPVR